MKRDGPVKSCHGIGTVLAMIAAAFIVTSSLTDEWLYSSQTRGQQLFQVDVTPLKTGYVYGPTYWGMIVKENYPIAENINNTTTVSKNQTISIEFEARRKIYTSDGKELDAWPSPYWYAVAVLLCVAMLFTGLSLGLGIIAMCTQYNTSSLASWYMWIATVVTLAIPPVFSGGTDGEIKHINPYIRRVFVDYFDFLKSKSVYLQSLPDSNTTVAVCQGTQGNANNFNLGDTCEFHYGFYLAIFAFISSFLSAICFTIAGRRQQKNMMARYAHKQHMVG
eukprot:comp11812_c0_seq1/m.6430 comp11812_c0_seq1/g.6430  ORF comp11812_c0_seq1/g.6430 comp11812_c0_seq1/m.6430 type:complete len:278 (-) comp11812_c0_seq1:99-932(-)